jgi:uncharacterized protein YbjQ (UPF0145 family)
MPVHPQWVTTAFEFDGHRIVGYRGVVRGITVRSRNLIVNLGATIQTLFGGNITLYTELCERARQEAFDLMLEHAAQMGANAVVAMRRGGDGGALLRHRGRDRAGGALKRSKARAGRSVFPT